MQWIVTALSKLVEANSDKGKNLTANVLKTNNSRTLIINKIKI